jgi:hypothetical protein
MPKSSVLNKTERLLLADRRSLAIATQVATQP